MKDCKIIQDLLPSYLDEVLTENTRHVVEEHLETCDECKTYLTELRQQRLRKEQEIEEKGERFHKKLRRLRIYVKGGLIGFFITIGILLIPFLIVTLLSAYYS